MVGTCKTTQMNSQSVTTNICNSGRYNATCNAKPYCFPHPHSPAHSKASPKFVNKSGDLSLGDRRGAHFGFASVIDCMTACTFVVASVLVGTAPDRSATTPS